MVSELTFYLVKIKFFNFYFSNIEISYLLIIQENDHDYDKNDDYLNETL